MKPNTQSFKKLYPLNNNSQIIYNIKKTKLIKQITKIQFKNSFPLKKKKNSNNNNNNKSKMNNNNNNRNNNNNKYQQIEGEEEL